MSHIETFYLHTKSCERDQNPRGMLHGFESANQTIEPDALGQSIGWAHGGTE